jgi:outer membrane protein
VPTFYGKKEMKKMIANKNSLISAAVVGTLVALGIMAGMIIAPVKAQSVYASIGYVDIEAALNSHPQLDSVMAQIRTFQDQKMNELDEYQNVESLTEEQRRALMDDIYRIQDEVDAERQRLTNPLIQDIIDATTAVGEESGIEVILDAGAVMWGGLDLTPLIITRIQGG